MILKEPAEILRNFLSSVLDEPERDGFELRTKQVISTFDGDDSTTSFIIPSTKVLSVGEVSISSVVQQPYLDYDIDIDNHKIIFASAPATGTGNISVTYKTGDEDWILENENSMDLTKEAYPFININVFSENSEPQGSAEDDTYDIVSFQIDILAFKNIFCTFEGESLEGPNVKKYLSRKVSTACLTDWRFKIESKLFNPIKLNKGPGDFDEGLNNFREILEIQFNCFNVGV